MSHRSLRKAATKCRPQLAYAVLRLVWGPIWGPVWGPVWGLSLLATAGVGCSGTTSEERLVLGTQVSAIPQDSFENAFGWTLHIDGAWMSIGSLSLLEGEPVGHRSISPPKRRPWHELLIGTAHAHPGHYQEGSVLAEMLTPVSVDLITLTELAPSQAITGHAHSGKVVFETPAPAPYASTLQDAIIRITGRAEKTNPADDGDATVRHFTARVLRSELSSTDAPAEVTGSPFEGGRLRAGGTIELRIDLALWFDQVDFEGVDGSDRPTFALEMDARAHNGFLRGVAKAAGYQFRFLEN